MTVLKNEWTDHNITMNMLYLKNLNHTHILENGNNYVDHHFGIPDQYMIDTTGYLLTGAYIFDAVDVAIAVIADALRKQVSIVQKVNGKVTYISCSSHKWQF